jgi:hypothetical protein
MRVWERLAPAAGCARSIPSDTFIRAMPSASGGSSNKDAIKMCAIMPPLEVGQVARWGVVCHRKSFRGRDFHLTTPPGTGEPGWPGGPPFRGQVEPIWDNVPDSSVEILAPVANYSAPSDWTKEVPFQAVTGSRSRWRKKGAAVRAQGPAGCASQGEAPIAVGVRFAHPDRKIVGCAQRAIPGPSQTMIEMVAITEPPSDEPFQS